MRLHASRIGASALVVGMVLGVVLLPACNDPWGSRPLTVGLVNHMPTLTPTVEGFKAGMRDLGYIEDASIRYLSCGLVAPTEDAIQQEIERLLGSGIDLLFTVGSLPTRTARRCVKGTGTPVVFGCLMNPVEDGIVTSLRRPGGNFTGVTDGRAVAKALEWLLAAAPATRQVLIPYNPADHVSTSVLPSVQLAASRLGVALILREVGTPTEALAALQQIPASEGAVFRVPSPTLDPATADLSLASVQRRLPLGAPQSLDRHVLLSFAADFDQVGRQAARLAHQILQGIAPADLPVEEAELYLTVDLRTADALGLSVPQDVIDSADRVIR